LTKSMLLACLWTIAKSQQQQQELNCTIEDGELPENQFGRNRFEIDALDSFLFPYAIGRCTSGHLYQSDRWYMYECSQDSNNVSTVTKTQYTDDVCSGPGMIVDQFIENNVTEGMKGYFDCDGFSSYLQMEFSLNPQCQNPVMVYGALGSCVNFVNSSSSSLQMNMFCEEDGARMQIFNFMLNSTSMTTIEPFNATLPSMISNNQTEMCSVDAFCDKWMLTGECALLTDLPFGNNQTQLYARWLACLTLAEATSSTELIMSTTELMSSTEAEATNEPTAMSTDNVIEEVDSSAIRPSFFFATGLFFVLSFIFSI